MNTVLRARAAIALCSSVFAISGAACVDQSGAPPAISTQDLPSVVQVLPWGAIKSGLSGGESSWITFKVDAPLEADLLVVESYGGKGDADIVLRRDLPPTPLHYDFDLRRYGNSEFLNFAITGGDTWYIGVFGYEEYAGLNLWADYSTFGTPDYLYNDVESSRLAGAKDSWRYFQVDVPEDAYDAFFETNYGEGDCDLYVRRGKLPTTSFYTKRDIGPGTKKFVDFTFPKKGTYFVGVRGGTSGYVDAEARAEIF